jgi:hypothetical protein
VRINKLTAAGGRKLIFTAALLGLALLLLIIPATPRLSVIHDGVAVLYIDINDGERFTIRYTHSVNRSDVDDIIERSGSGFIVRSSLFRSFGAGIPIADDIINGKEAGASLVRTDEGLLLDGIDTYYKEINLITGTYANHRLIAGGTEYVLRDIVGIQERIILKIEYISILRLLNTKIEGI